MACSTDCSILGYGQWPRKQQHNGLHRIDIKTSFNLCSKPKEANLQLILFLPYPLGKAILVRRGGKSVHTKACDVLEHKWQVNAFSIMKSCPTMLRPTNWKVHSRGSSWLVWIPGKKMKLYIIRGSGYGIYQLRPIFDYTTPESVSKRLTMTSVLASSSLEYDELVVDLVRVWLSLSPHPLGMQWTRSSCSDKVCLIAVHRVLSPLPGLERLVKSDKEVWLANARASDNGCFPANFIFFSQLTKKNVILESLNSSFIENLGPVCVYCVLHFR